MSRCASSRVIRRSSGSLGRDPDLVCVTVVGKLLLLRDVAASTASLSIKSAIVAASAAASSAWAAAAVVATFVSVNVAAEAAYVFIIVAAIVPSAAVTATNVAAFASA